MDCWTERESKWERKRRERVRKGEREGRTKFTAEPRLIVIIITAKKAAITALLIIRKRDSVAKWDDDGTMVVEWGMNETALRVQRSSFHREIYAAIFQPRSHYVWYILYSPWTWSNGWYKTYLKLHIDISIISRDIYSPVKLYRTSDIKFVKCIKIRTKWDIFCDASPLFTSGTIYTILHRLRATSVKKNIWKSVNNNRP